MAAKKKNTSKKIIKPQTSAVKKADNKKNYWKYFAIMIFLILIFVSLVEVDINIRPKAIFRKNVSQQSTSQTFGKSESQTVNVSELQSKVIAEEGVSLPIIWNDFGKRMVEDGVIDEQKFRSLFKEGLSDEEDKILTGSGNGEIVLTMENSRFLLDMLWAFGLANKNEILTSGEMTDAKYGGDASKFASTGGWTLSTGNVMNHYSKHSYVVLTTEQQALVDRVSRGIFRPCCGNSTHFPDCNHGMAMLGLLELMAANNVSENKMYEVALKVNSYWFPQTYLDLATYFKEQGTDWGQVDPKTVLGQQYSSGQGYAATRQKIKSLPTPAAGGGGCGV